MTSICSQLQAQETSDKEIGLRLANIRDFNLIYKSQLNSGKYLRLRTANTTFSINDLSTQISAGINIGVEKRKQIFGKPELIFGPEFGIFYSGTWLEGLSGFNFFSATIGYIIGIQHPISDYFNIGIELIPNVGATFNTGATATIRGGFNFTTVGLFATYRLGGKQGMK